MPRKRQQRNIGKARELRAAMSLPEVLLWRILRTEPQGVKFRRQHPLGPYVLDFYCAEKRVCIEIDGIAHDMGDRPDRDEVRNTWLKQEGIDLLRVPATDILHSPEDVAEALAKYCKY